MSAPPRRPADVLRAIGQIGIVALATVDRVDDALRAASALMAGGIRCLEVTLRTDAGLAAINAVRTSHPDLLVGAGTVLDTVAVDAAVDAGAQFVVSPGFDDAVVARCHQRQVPTLPGVATPTEMMRARSAGLDVVKFFPAAAAGGVAGLAAMSAAVGGLSFVATGGIGPDEVPRYLALDAVRAVGGSWIVDPRLVAERRWADVEQRVRDAAAMVATLRKGAAR